MAAGSASYSVSRMRLLDMTLQTFLICSARIVFFHNYHEELITCFALMT